MVVVAYFLGHPIIAILCWYAETEW